jgi:RNA polymerase sigma-70 factor (ECF subfamily)
MIIPARRPHSLDVGEAPASPDFREVFDAHVRFVWRSLLGLGVGEADVPDASQQVFLVLHAKLERLEPDCALRTFVYGICLRVASDHRRRAHVRREHLFAEPPERVAAATQEDRASHREALASLQDTLDRLDPDQRAVFVLYELEELDMIEVARAVGCPLQTAYSRLHAARRVVAAAFATDEARAVSAARRRP